MVQKSFSGDHLRSQYRIFCFVCFAFTMGLLVSCHRAHSKKKQANEFTALSAEDSLLGQQFPLSESYWAQKELLYKFSKPTKNGLVLDGEMFEGNFGNGVIELILDEIDGEPNGFYGHLEGDNPPETIEFIVYGITNEKLDKLVNGQKYRVHWIETVVFMEPFDDYRNRYFVAYKIDAL